MGVSVRLILVRIESGSFRAENKRRISKFPVAQSQVAKGYVKGNDSKIVTGFLPKGHNSTSKLKFWVSYIDFALRLRTECAQKENIIQLDICNVLYYISYW